MSTIVPYRVFHDNRNFGDFVETVMQEFQQKKVAINDASFQFSRSLDNVGASIFRRRVTNDVSGGSLVDAVMDLAEKLKV